MAVFPNRFPNREEKIINRKRLSQLFLAIFKVCLSSWDWLNLTAIVLFQFLMTHNAEQLNTCCCPGVFCPSASFYLKPLLNINFSHVFIHRLLLIKCLLSYLCFVFVFSSFFHPSIMFAWPPSLCLYSCMGRDGKNWNHRAVTQVGFSLIRIWQWSVLCFVLLVDTHAHLTNYMSSPSSCRHSCDIYSCTNISAVARDEKHRCMN